MTKAEAQSLTATTGWDALKERLNAPVSVDSVKVDGRSAYDIAVELRASQIFATNCRELVQMVEGLSAKTTVEKPSYK